MFQLPRMSSALASAVALTMCLVGAAQAASKVERIIDPAGKFPFSAAVWAGDTLYISGQIGYKDGQLVAGFEAQSRQAMDNIFETLKQAGLQRDDLAKCTIMIGDMKKWPEFNKIYQSYFEPNRYPARSAFGANGLALGADVEIECIAFGEHRERK